MHRTLRCLTVVTALAAVAPLAGAQARGRTTTASASPGSTELGLDGELAFNRYDNSNENTTTLGLPIQRFRIGFNADQQLEWEPWGALNYISAGNDVSGTALGLGLGALWHLNTTRTENQWYLRPFLDLTHVSNSFRDNAGNTVTVSSTQWGLGAGAGVKLPIADRFAARFEGNLEHRFKGGSMTAGNVVALLAGLSLYTH